MSEREDINKERIIQMFLGFNALELEYFKKYPKMNSAEIYVVGRMFLRTLTMVGEAKGTPINKFAYLDSLSDELYEKIERDIKARGL